MTQRQVLEQVSVEEFKQWVAYFALESEEYKEKLERQIALEQSAAKSDEERADDIKRLLGFYNGTDR